LITIDPQAIRAVLLGFSVVLSILFFPYGLNFYILIKRASEYKVPKASSSKKFKVTVQLPIFNELYVVKRLIDACIRMTDRYGKNFVQILLLDDSTDETTEFLIEMVKKYKALGYDIDIIHRNSREGFKAGALQNALKYTKYEFIAIFDADFVPPEEFLIQVMPYFEDEKLGLIQCRWAHLNRDYNLITKAIAIGYDGHHIIEQTGRWAGGFLLNFNGSAGVIRRVALEEAGGWQSDTLAEDLDVSYRMQLKGWKALYLRDVKCWAEIPPTIPAIKKQQSRWANGSIRTFRKLCIQILKNKSLTLGKKVEALIHLSFYAVHPLMVLAYLIALISAILDVRLVEFDVQAILTSPIEKAGVMPNMSFFMKLFAYMQAISISVWEAVNYMPQWVALNISIFFCAISMWIFYAQALKYQNIKIKNEVKSLGALCLIGFGISISNTLAIIKGFFGRSSGTFFRTPKYKIEKITDTWKDKKYQVKLSKIVLLELIAGALGLLGILRAIFSPSPNLGIIPILLLYTIAYFYIAKLTLQQSSKE
jgi:cellulose synthase/poly-beta-1,6-N-acetylglucosamine synthase-like glycosyltransferase